MEFEYNEGKSLVNKEKHGIDFEESKMLWLEDNVILPAITKGELRYMTMGSVKSNIFSCIFTVRKKKIRIISCRKSRRSERKVYYEKIG